MAILYSNNAYATLAAGINSSATALTVASGLGARFPAISGSDFFYVTLVDSVGNLEIVKVTARSTDVFTIVRAQDSTAAQAFSLGDGVQLRIIKAMLDVFPQTGGPLGSPSTVGTMPAFTLGGTVAGGGNQINNVIIGTTTPLAGAFTTLSATGTTTTRPTTNTYAAGNLVLQDSNGLNPLGIVSIGGTFYFGAGVTDRMALSSTGLAVTGTLTATGGITSNIVAGNGNIKLDGAATGSPFVAFQQSGVDKGLIQYINATSSLDSTVGGGVTKLTTTGLAVTGTLSSTLGATIQGLTVGLGAGAVASNTVVGAGALAANISGTSNTAIGGTDGFYGSVLKANTIGIQNVAIGNAALASNISGSGNVAIGFQSGSSVTTASNNTSVGLSALQVNTASNNTAVGYQAAYTGTTATEVVAIGSGALKANTVNYGTAVGFNALTANTTGAANAAFGAYALSTNTIGEGNSAFGALGFGLSDSALQANLSGSYNSAFGLGALAKNTSASSNTAVGYQAGYLNQTGTLFTALGYQAGYASLATNRGTYIGSTSGLATTGAQNTFVGDTSGSVVTTGASNTILGRWDGNFDGLDIRTASNYLVISDGDGNRLLTSALNKTVALQGAVPNSGTGITFPATQSASSNAKTLDDYEEGTWEPSVGGTATYTQQQGSYIKVGRLVTVSFDMAILLLGTGSTSGMSGLPFTVGSATSPKMEQTHGAMGYVQSLAVNVYSLMFTAAANGTTIYSISMNTLGGTANVNPAIYGNGTRVQGTVTYMAVN